MNIRLNEISKTYSDGFRALESVSLELKSGEVVGLVGPNGSGKTTLLKLILGILQPTSGVIEVGGRRLGEGEWRTFKKGVGYMPERVSFYDNLTGMETLEFYARIKGGDVKNVDGLLKRLFEPGVLDRKVGGYSKGMRQRLNLVQSVINDPDLLILDEPTSGLDPVGRKEFYEILSEILHRKNPIVVLSSHMLAEIEDRVSRVGILKNGTLVAVGKLDELYRQFKLPLKLSIIFAPGGGNTVDIEDMLRSKGARITSAKEGGIHAELPMEIKLDALDSLMAARDKFVDFTIKEPRLEEVFFGFN